MYLVSLWPKSTIHILPGPAQAVGRHNDDRYNRSSLEVVIGTGSQA